MFRLNLTAMKIIRASSKDQNQSIVSTVFEKQNLLRPVSHPISTAHNYKCYQANCRQSPHRPDVPRYRLCLYTLPSRQSMPQTALTPQKFPPNTPMSPSHQAMLPSHASPITAPSHQVPQPITIALSQMHMLAHRIPMSLCPPRGH